METAKEPKIIKRYQNRKLYDTHQSCYVTLEEIARMIRAGDDLKVIDNKTQRDITSSTLTQLLFETEKKSNKVVPIGLLKEIIKSGDGSFSGFIMTRLKDSIKDFDLSVPEVEERPVVAPVTTTVNSGVSMSTSADSGPTITLSN